MDFTNKLVLAPMAGVCDQPFRLLAKEQGFIHGNDQCKGVVL